MKRRDLIRLARIEQRARPADELPTDLLIHLSHVTVTPEEALRMGRSESASSIEPESLTDLHLQIVETIDIDVPEGGLVH